jgi:hypothetical protein
MTGWQIWGGRLARALSVRVIVLALVGGVGVGVLVGMKWPDATMPAVWTTAGVLYIIAIFNDGQMIKCAACGKRVKLGATTCHHCGYSGS